MLIDANKLTRQIERMKDVNRDDVIALIARQRPVDGVPREQYQRMVDTAASLTEYIGNIVRCKDCKHNQLPPTSAKAMCDLWCGMTDSFHYCLYGERRDDETD